VLEDPAEGCREIRFAAPLTLEPAAQVALEDYARVLTRARHAEVRGAAPLRAGYDAGPIAGVHLCAPEAACDGQPAADVEAFARELAVTPVANGLGWN
jgi:hypothetical protein